MAVLSAFTLLSAGMAVFAWRRRPAPAAGALCVLFAANALWLAGEAAENAAPSVGGKLLALAVRYVGVMATPAAFLAVALTWTGRGALLTRRRLLLLGAFPGLGLLLVWTNRAHGLMFPTVRLDPRGFLDLTHGPAFLVHTAYSYAVLLGAFVLILERTARERAVRGQGVAMLFALAGPGLANLAFLGLKLTERDLTPVALAAACLALAYSLLRHGLPDVLPLAQETVIDSLPDGVVVLDAQDRVADLNRTAAEFLGRPGEDLLGLTAAEVFGSEGLFAGVLPEETVERVLHLGARVCEARLSRLPAGAYTGHVVLLRDVTRQREAERERLLLAQALRSSGEAILVADASDHMVFVNDAFGRLYGYAPGEVLGRPVSMLRAPGNDAEALASIQPRTQGGGWEGELLQARRDGSTFTIHVRTAPVAGDRPGEQASVAVARDVSERRRMEAALRRQNQYLAALNEVALGLMDRLELPDLLQAILPLAGHLIGAPHGYVFLLAADGEAMETRAGTGVFAGPAERIAHGVGLVGCVWARAEPVRVEDYDVWPQRDPSFPAGVLGAVIGVPLRARDRVVGVVGLAHGREGGRPFSGDDVRVLLGLTDLAALALENAKLWASVQREIEERRRAEDALQASRARYRDLVERASDAITRLDPAGRFSYVNPALCRLLGRTPEELLGRSFLDYVAPDHRERVAEFYATQYFELRAQTHQELPYLRVDGSLLWAGQSVQLLLEDAVPTGFQAVVRDVTERRRAEEALAQSEARYRDLVEQASDALWRLDSEGRLTYANPALARLLRRPPEDLVGASYLELLPPEARGSVGAFYRDQAARAVAHTRLEVPLLAGDGATVWLECHTQAVLDEAGAPAGFQGMGRDITERKRAEQALERANLELTHAAARARELAEAARAASVAKSRFLANMSHELRTPLNAILGYAELVQDGIYGAVPEALHEVLGRVIWNGRELLGLINDVLDLAKMEAGRLALTHEPCSLAEVVEEVLDKVRPGALAKDLDLHAQVPRALPAVRGDRARLAQALANVVGNAVKFTDVGQVSLNVRPLEGALLVSVRDTGPGIDETARGHIFEEFAQAGGAAVRTAGGTGLGLAIARRIVELHGGRLWVESEPGLGSTFHLELPAEGAPRA